jgi:hypothetical protein
LDAVCFSKVLQAEPVAVEACDRTLGFPKWIPVFFPSEAAWNPLCEEEGIESLLSFPRRKLLLDPPVKFSNPLSVFFAIIDFLLHFQVNQDKCIRSFGRQRQLLHAPDLFPHPVLVKKSQTFGCND